MPDPSAKRIATELGDALRAFGFTVDALSAGLDEVQDALVDLLIEHVMVAEERIPLALLGPLQQIGVVHRRDDGTLSAPRDVRPYSDGARDLFIASDADQPVDSGTEHVLGVGQASLTLASLVPRIAVGRALDLGTGSGVQALHLAAHAHHVVATDVSAEALECAALSAALSGIDVELRRGSLYEPVEGERFDLIVSNPPFVISPRKQFTYRDAGREGDDFVRELISGAHEYLNEDGWLVTLANWLHPRGRDWRERLMEWIGPTGCDAWVVERDRVAPADYVRTWLADAGSEPDGSWLQWFSDNDIEAIGFGWVILHNTGRDFPHRRFEVLTHSVEQPMGPWVQERFLLADLAADLEDSDLLAMRFTKVESSIAGDLLQVGRGWRRQGRIDQATALLLAALDPSRSVAEVIAGLPFGDQIAVEEAGDLVRGLLELGALRPVRD